MLLILASFFAGMLTVLAPCVLPLLPVIIGGSLGGDTKDRKRPLIIVASLSISLLVFTLLLKATTLLIDIPERSIFYISGGIIIALGILTLMPGLYARFIAATGIEKRAKSGLAKGTKSKNNYIGPIITGAALGPVFSSCSPVYAYLIATVLPIDFAKAFINIIAFILGLAFVLLLISSYGQRFVAKLRFASNPKGWFQKAIGTLFIVVGLLIATGLDKDLQVYVSQHTPFKFDQLTSKLIPSNEKIKKQGGVLNVQPYEAPEFMGLENWLNSEPLTLKNDLKGKIVYVDFWTYSCINCIRNNPYIEGWYQKYKDQGFTVVGAHAPEFAFEKVPANVEKAVRDQNITYPVALDNQFATWNAFANNSWPAGYLIDADGMIRRVHFGEGEYIETEEAIRALLIENGARLDGSFSVKEDRKDDDERLTAETYLGSKRASNYSTVPALAANPISNFKAVENLDKNRWTLGGKWQVESEKIISKSDSSKLIFRISSKTAFIVAGAGSDKKITVMLDGQPISQVNSAGEDVSDSQLTVSGNKLYRLVSHENFNDDYLLELIVPIGVELNVFTFGS